MQSIMTTRQSLAVARQSVMTTLLWKLGSAVVRKERASADAPLCASVSTNIPQET
jgi:hypothetical protein